MNAHARHGLAIALDELVMRIVEPLPRDGMPGIFTVAMDEDEPLGLVDRFAARIAAWVELLEGRAIPSFGPFSTSGWKPGSVLCAIRARAIWRSTPRLTDLCNCGSLAIPAPVASAGGVLLVHFTDFTPRRSALV